MNDAPPPVIHPINCICRVCCDARRDYVIAMREERRGRAKAFGEATVKPPRKAQPGTLRALVKIGRAS